MPGGDGTGPLGNGPVTGRGVGAGAGGRGRNGGIGAGPSGFCVCPKCGEKVAHVTGTACVSVKCPKCGANMIRG